MRIRSINTALRRLLVGLALLMAPVAFADDFPEFNRDPAQARIVTEDLDRFWAAWDLAEAQPEARREIFQREYLDAGSPGLKAFIELRIQDVDRLLAAIDSQRDYYAALRAQMPNAAAAAEPVREALQRLQAQLPEAVFPDVYLLIGILNTGGTLHWEGLLIGLEMYGLTPDTDLEPFGAWHRAVLKPMEELPAIIVHELVHFQQLNISRTSFDTLLGRAIHEGAADFVAERLLGRHINQALHAWALPREALLWAEFRQVMDGQDNTGWLYDGANAPAGRPADLGYFIGYRITEAWYEQAEDKHAALHGILAMTDPTAFLEASGYARRMAEANAAGPRFVVVRHAEKQTGEGVDAKDPGLTAEGQQRAERLARSFAGSGLAAVYATPYRRARDTAAPAAQAFGLDITEYDAHQPAEDFIASLRTAHPEGVVLVVGHSNTVPAIVAALCSCDVAEMTEAEYEHRFIVDFDADGRARMVDLPLP